MGAAALHYAGDCADPCGLCDAEEAEAAAADPCEVCGAGFDADSFAVRHTAPSGADIHADCCGQCAEEDSRRRPRIDRRSFRYVLGGVTVVPAVPARVTL